MQKILFYDGDCGFCNKSVQFVLNNERNSDIYFAALQSKFAQNFFKENNFPEVDFSTFYFWNGNTLFKKSTGALKVINDLKIKWHFLKFAFIIPTFIRDKMYDFIAKRRHNLNVGFCAFPTLEQKKRFI